MINIRLVNIEKVCDFGKVNVLNRDVSKSANCSEMRAFSCTRFHSSNRQQPLNLYRNEYMDRDVVISWSDGQETEGLA